ncbi:MAG TPA: YbaB/EbfC family nucleoid-associated protein [Acidimicrobiales bacterium]|nr:YbaB/EbfC family nucleoid-associated protein [Acidimicrobiales bacterium]
MPSDEEDLPDEAADDEEADDEEGEGDEDGETHELAGSLSDLLAQLEAVSEELEEEAEEASEVIVEGSSAGGSVLIQLTGALEAVSVRIDPTLVDPADVAMLEDAVLAALRDGLSQVVEFRRQLESDIEGTEVDLSGLLGKLGGLAGFGGLGLPDLGGLGNPEALIAELRGALGSLPGGLGGNLAGGLGDVMAGLGLRGGAPAAPGPTEGYASAEGAAGTTDAAAGTADAAAGADADGEPESGRADEVPRSPE